MEPAKNFEYALEPLDVIEILASILLDGADSDDRKLVSHPNDKSSAEGLFSGTLKVALLEKVLNALARTFLGRRLDVNSIEHVLAQCVLFSGGKLLQRGRRTKGSVVLVFICVEVE